jgi:hypothetical protein
VPLVDVRGPPIRLGFRSLKNTWADTTTPHGRIILAGLGGKQTQSPALLPPDVVRRPALSSPQYCFSSRHYVVFWFIDAMFCELRAVR